MLKVEVQSRYDITCWPFLGRLEEEERRESIMAPRHAPSVG